MKRLSFLIASAALFGALIVSGPAEAFRGAGFRAFGWHGGFSGWRGGSWGWAGNRWGWNRGWGWSRGWDWGGWWLAYAGLGVAATYPWRGWGYPYYGYYGYDYPYGYYSASALAAAPLVVAAAAAPPLVTGRSVATGQAGNHCTTAVTNCELRHASYVGGGCSYRVAGGRARGIVVP